VTSGAVSSKWELVRQAADGSKQVVASSVASFDLARDGSLIVTNGRKVERLAPDGRREEIATDHLVQQVAALA